MEKLVIKSCIIPECKNTFEVKLNSKQRYCSDCIHRIRSERMKNNNPMDNPESRRKLSESRTGQEAWNKGLTKETDQRVANHSKVMSGRSVSEEHKRAVGEAKLIWWETEEGQKRKEFLHSDKNPVKSAEVRAKCSANNAMNNPENRQKVREALLAFYQTEEGIKNREEKVVCNVDFPNKAETFLNNFLKELLPGEWKYTGDFSLRINGKNPDFVNINGQKKIIELFGDYWHGEERTGRTRIEEEEHRKACFKDLGYRVLIIWQSEFKNFEKLEDKIFHFYYSY